MTFNRELAKQIAGDDDRDRARYFAGREAEIATFGTALDNSSGKRQSVFRVFIGAPGCGKSSLLQRLTDLHQDDSGLLFVHPTDAQLSSVADLMGHIADRAIAEASAVDSDRWRSAVERHGVIALQSAAEFAPDQNRWDVLQEWLQARALDGLTVVVSFDEAQNAPSDVLETLAVLHKAGLPGVASVVLLAGLSHAKSILKKAGISRMADNANVDMGAMALEECAESTRLMLDDLGVEGTDAEVGHFTQRIAEHSRGWPQHLNRAQKALCQGLLEANGALRDVDRQAVERMATRRVPSIIEGVWTTNALAGIRNSCSGSSVPLTPTRRTRMRTCVPLAPRRSAHSGETRIPTSRSHRKTWRTP